MVKKLHQEIEWLERYLDYYIKTYPSHIKYIEKITIKINEKKKVLARLS